MTNKAESTLACWELHTYSTTRHIQGIVWSIYNFETRHSYSPWNCEIFIDIMFMVKYNDRHFCYSSLNAPFVYFQMSTYHGQWWSILRTHWPQTEQWWALSGLTWEHSEQYRTSPWIDLIATGKSLLTANCSNVVRGSLEASMASISATDSANLNRIL